MRVLRVVTALGLAAFGCADEGDPGTPLSLMTFNIGTSPGLPHGSDGNAYTPDMADIADELYENSLSWNPAEAALTAFLAEARPTIVVFQEGFYDRWCEEIEVDPNLDFVCNGYTPDRPLQVERVLGPDYQVACADGQEDNCAGVLRSFATMRGCPADGPCLGGLEGMGPADGCSNGARVGRVILDLADGRELVLVNVHGTSGLEQRDMDCRASQFRQIFVDRGDGEPAASGEANLVMGDFNTDPVVTAGRDPSADVLLEHVGDGKRYHFISPFDAGPKSYQDALRIDHIISDGIRGGDCVVPGVDGEPPVLDAVYWDHKPVFCDGRF